MLDSPNNSTASVGSQVGDDSAPYPRIIRLPTITWGIGDFLRRHETPFNSDLVALWSPAMESQTNAVADGARTITTKKGGKFFSDGKAKWWSVRIPKDSDSKPWFRDYRNNRVLFDHVEAVGMTGFDWQNRCSRWVTFDFDSIAGHAAGVGVSEGDLDQIKTAAMQLPYVQTRRSSGGSGLHAYVFLDAIPAANHSIHAQTARAVLDKMSGDVGFDFADHVDAVGGVCWIWHRKATLANRGFERLEAA